VTDEQVECGIRTIIDTLRANSKVSRAREITMFFAGIVAATIVIGVVLGIAWVVFHDHFKPW
jgi:predicted nucleic acid-binding Zn ribbon protein